MVEKTGGIDKTSRLRPSEVVGPVGCPNKTVSASNELFRRGLGGSCGSEDGQNANGDPSNGVQEVTMGRAQSEEKRMLMNRLFKG